ncbi:MAG: rhomboid family intramembrane serine protease [Sulfolobales archaeon]
MSDYDMGSKARATLFIILLNIVAYTLFSYRNAFLYTDPQVVERYGFKPIYLLSLEGVIRIFLSMFIHADLFHILFNMITLYYFGREIESLLGRVRFVLLYLASGVLASVYYTLLSLPQVSSLTIPAVGASGAISGLLGSYMILMPRTNMTMCIFLPIPICGSFNASLFLLIWLGVQILYGLLGYPSIAFFAHVGGFIAGVTLTFILSKPLIRTLRGGVLYDYLYSECGGMPLLSKLIALTLDLILLIYIVLIMINIAIFSTHYAEYFLEIFIFSLIISLLLTSSSLYIILFKDKEINIDC